MLVRKVAPVLLPFAYILLASVNALAQSQTTGRLTGTVTDPNGAVIVGAEVTVSNNATGETRKALTKMKATTACRSCRRAYMISTSRFQGLKGSKIQLPKLKVASSSLVARSNLVNNSSIRFSNVREMSETSSNVPQKSSLATVSLLR
jgi:hypothetical protein